MTEKDKHSWASDELSEVDATDSQKSLVQKLLSVYWEEGVEDGTVIDMFSKLATGEGLSAHKLIDTYSWLEAKPGNVYVRDVVRVKEDAYPPRDRRSSANGREGVVVAIRYGTVSVHYTDGPEASIPASFTQHRLQLLEKRY